MAVWFKLLIIFVVILIGDCFIYISAKAKAKAEFGEQFINKMQKELDEIANCECSSISEVRMYFAKISTWKKAFVIVKEICGVDDAKKP